MPAHASCASLASKAEAGTGKLVMQTKVGRQIRGADRMRTDGSEKDEASQVDDADELSLKLRPKAERERERKRASEQRQKGLIYSGLSLIRQS